MSTTVIKGQPTVLLYRLFSETKNNPVDISQFIEGVTIIDGFRKSMTAVIQARPHVTRAIIGETGRIGNYQPEHQTLFEPLSAIIAIKLPENQTANFDFLGFLDAHDFSRQTLSQKISKKLTLICNSLISEIMSAESRFFYTEPSMQNILSGFKEFEKIIAWLKDSVKNQTTYDNIEDLIKYVIETTSILQNLSVSAEGDSEITISDLIQFFVRGFPGDKFVKPGFYSYQGNIKGMIDSLVEPSLYVYYETMLNGRNTFVLKPFPYEYRDPTLAKSISFRFSGKSKGINDDNDSIPEPYKTGEDQLLSRYWDEPARVHTVDSGNVPGERIYLNSSAVFTVHSTRAATDAIGAAQPYILKNIYNLDMMKRYGIRVRETLINSIALSPTTPMAGEIPADPGEVKKDPYLTEYNSIQLKKRNLLYQYYGYPFYFEGSFSFKPDPKKQSILVGDRVRLNHIRSEKGNPIEVLISTRTRKWTLGGITLHTYEFVRGHDPKMVAEFWEKTGRNAIAGEVLTLTQEKQVLGGIDNTLSWGDFS